MNSLVRVEMDFAVHFEHNQVCCCGSPTLGTNATLVSPSPSIPALLCCLKLLRQQHVVWQACLLWEGLGGGHQDWHLFSIVPLWLCSERVGGHEATEPREKGRLQ